MATEKKNGMGKYIDQTKQGHAITPIHFKNASKFTKKSKYIGHRGQA